MYLIIIHYSNFVDLLSVNRTYDKETERDILHHFYYCDIKLKKIHIK